MSIHEPYIYGSTPATHRSCHYHPRTSCIIYILREQVCSIIKLEDENSIIIIKNQCSLYSRSVHSIQRILTSSQINPRSHSQFITSSFLHERRLSTSIEHHILHSFRLVYYGIKLELSPWHPQTQNSIR